MQRRAVRSVPVYLLYVGINAADLTVEWRLLFFAVVWLLTVAIASASFRWFELPLAER